MVSPTKRFLNMLKMLDLMCYCNSTYTSEVPSTSKEWSIFKENLYQQGSI